MDVSLQIIDACLLHINSYITKLFDIAHWNDISGEPFGQGTMYPSVVFPERAKQCSHKELSSTLGSVSA